MWCQTWLDASCEAVLSRCCMLKLEDIMQEMDVAVLYMNCKQGHP